MRLECLSFCPSTSNCLIWSNRSEADDFFVPEDFIGRTGLDWPPGRTTGGAMKDAPPLAIVYIFLERVKTNQLIELSITCKWHHSVCKYWPSSLISEALWVLTLSPITTFCFVFIYSGKFEMRMLWNALWTTTLYLLQLTWNCTRVIKSKYLKYCWELNVKKNHVWYRKGTFFNLHGKKIKWIELQFVIFQSSTSRRCLFYILLLSYNNPLNMKI